MMNMNERIKQLALAAFQPINDISTEGVADFHTFNQPWFQLYNQEFAELIVGECIDEIKTLRGKYDTHRDVEPEENDWYVDALLQAEVRLKEHFSVSEPPPRLDTMWATNPHPPIPCVLTNRSEGIEPIRNLFGKPFTVDSRNKK
jgi:hypothetical protein